MYGNKDIFGNTQCFEVNSQVFNKITYRQNNEGILAVMQAENLILNDIKLSDLPLIIVLEAVEKPGNLGAVLRTADAVGADAVIVCDPQTDIYNPNVIRSSLGCVFTKQIAVCSSEEAFQWLKRNNIEPIAASLSATKLHFNTNMNKPVAFIMGTEASGLTDFWLQNTKTQVMIPMLGKIDSLNVSASPAILVYEALRQKCWFRYCGKNDPCPVRFAGIHLLIIHKQLYCGNYPNVLNVSVTHLPVSPSFASFSPKHVFSDVEQNPVQTQILKVTIQNSSSFSAISIIL